MLPSSRSCLSTGGLEMRLAALQRLDPYIRTIVDVASQVALYTFNRQSSQWEKTEVGGTLFIYNRLTSPRHGFTIMNRLGTQNLTEAVTHDLDLQLQEPFLLYRSARLVIHGIWFYDRQDCRRVTDLIKLLTQQEQVQVQSQTNACDRLDGAAVDILQMLTKAQSQYEKKNASSEPKEIRVSEDLHRNLIKPIPVKPGTQDAKSSGSKSISQDNLCTTPAPCSSAAAWGCCHPVADILPYKKHTGPEVLLGAQNPHLNCSAHQKLSRDHWGTVAVPTENLHRHHLHPPHLQLQTVPGVSSSSSHVLCPSRPLHHFEGSSQGSGSLSPHELLQKLQLVQRQQTRVSLGLPPSQTQDHVHSLPTEAQLQVVCPERVPATASAATLLLSPSVFTRFQSRRHFKVLSRSQLQAALLHLIQSDSSFLDNIYHAYVSRSSSICSSK